MISWRKSPRAASPRGLFMSRLGRPAGADDGVALVVVVGSMLVLAMLAMTALAYTLSSQKFARHDQDYLAAMTAAQSGVEDVISRLNRDDTFGTVLDCSDTAWKGPTTETNTCGWTTSTAPGWLPVKPGETDPAAAWFHYSIDASTAGTQGTITVTSTGRVNGVYRTVQTAVGKGGSTDYVYYTNFEDADPSNVQAYPPDGATTAVCGGGTSPAPKYWYQGRSGCQEITFISGDELDGAVFTNDSILSSGASFLKGVESANPGCSSVNPADPTTWNSCLRPGSTANFNGIAPKLADPKYLDDNSAAFATNPGCHYYGSTRVIFSSNGKMTVWNKTSNNDGRLPTSIAPPGGTAPNCGTSLSDLDNGVTLDVPDNMVIYVAPSTVSKRQCFGGEIGGPSGRELPLGDYSSADLTPTSGTKYTFDTNMTEVDKFCGEGNLYVEGTLKGRVTVSAAQSVIATGDIVLAGGMNGSDMLGLVATNSVEIFHPRLEELTYTYSHGVYRWIVSAGESEVSGWPTRYTDPTTGTKNPSTGIQIAGSIQTLQHSFLVQKYNVGGDAGTLLVNGSIAQKWRGIVGQGSGWYQNGYTKLYRYDTRLQYSTPPYFPRWANSQWSLRYSGEITTPGGVRNSSP